MIWSTEGPMLICAAVSTGKQRLSCHIWYELYQPLIHIPYTTVSSEETWVDLFSAAKVNTTVEEELQYNAVQFSKSALWSVFCGVWSVCCGVSSVECGVSTVECLLWSVYCPLWSPYCGVSIVECGVHTVECLAVWARRALALSHCHHSIAWAAAEWCTATTSTALPPLLLLLHTTATTSIALCHHVLLLLQTIEATAVHWRHVTMHCCCLKIHSYS